MINKWLIKGTDYNIILKHMEVITFIFGVMIYLSWCFL